MYKKEAALLSLLFCIGTGQIIQSALSFLSIVVQNFLPFKSSSMVSFIFGLPSRISLSTRLLLLVFAQ